jgi:hypothetical protein
MGVFMFSFKNLSKLDAVRGAQVNFFEVYKTYSEKKFPKRDNEMRQFPRFLGRRWLRRVT